MVCCTDQDFDIIGLGEIKKLENDRDPVGGIFLIMPNPAVHNINIQYNLPITFTNSNVAISDLMGNLLINTPILGQIGTVSIDVSALQNGAYLCRIVGVNSATSGQILTILKN